MDVGKLAVTFLENNAVYADGNTSAATGLDVAKSLSVAVSAGRVVQYTTDPLDRSSLVAGDETVTVSVEHSDDNSTWVEADSHEFTEDGATVLTVSSPKAYVRVAWDLSGTSPQPILSAHAVASGKTQDQIGGSLPDDPLTTDLGLVAPQTITTATFTTVVFAVVGTDEIGVTIDGSGLVTLPAGWFLASGEVYWGLDNTGSRYLSPKLGDTLQTDVIVSGAEYAILDNGNGHTFGPNVFHTAGGADAFHLQVYQNSGGNLDVGSGVIARLQQVA